MARYCLFVAGLAIVCGCSSLPTAETQIEAAPAAYETAQITYLDSAIVKPAAPAGDASHVSYEALSGDAPPARAPVTLSIKYPHPQGRIGYALAEVVIEEPDAAKQSETSGVKAWFASFGKTAGETLPGLHYSDGIRGAYALDIERAELDQVLNRMKQGGYFDQVMSATDDVHLIARVDGARYGKRWGRVGELENLRRRVQREGRLVSYVTSAGTGTNATAEPPSARVARELAEQSQVPGLAAAEDASGPTADPYGPSSVPIVPGHLVRLPPVGAE